MPSLRPLAIRLVIYSTLLMAVAMVLKSRGIPAIPDVMYPLIAGYGVLTYTLSRMILKANAKSPQRFVTAFMGAVTLKLLISAFFLLVYLYITKEHKVVVSLGVFAIYIVNTWLMISFLMKQVSHNNQSPKV
jgi:hypothetical protein